jgi:hypothetical protein
MQGDRRPDILHITLWNTEAPHEVARRICAVDLEAVVEVGATFGQAHIVEHGADIEQLRVVFQPLPLTGQSSPQEDAAGMVVQQVILGVPDELGGGLRQRAVRHRDSSDGIRHFDCSFLDGQIAIGSLAGNVASKAISSISSWVLTVCASLSRALRSAESMSCRAALEVTLQPGRATARA